MKKNFLWPLSGGSGFFGDVPGFVPLLPPESTKAPRLLDGTFTPEASTPLVLVAADPLCVEPETGTLLNGFLAGEVTEQEREAFIQHLLQCLPCALAVENSSRRSTTESADSEVPNHALRLSGSGQFVLLTPPELGKDPTGGH